MKLTLLYSAILCCTLLTLFSCQRQAEEVKPKVSVNTGYLTSPIYKSFKAINMAKVRSSVAASPRRYSRVSEAFTPNSTLGNGFVYAYNQFDSVQDSVVAVNGYSVIATDTISKFYALTAQYVLDVASDGFIQPVTNTGISTFAAVWGASGDSLAPIMGNVSSLPDYFTKLGIVDSIWLMPAIGYYYSKIADSTQNSIELENLRLAFLDTLSLNKANIDQASYTALVNLINTKTDLQKKYGACNWLQRLFGCRRAGICERSHPGGVLNWECYRVGNLLQGTKNCDIATDCDAIGPVSGSYSRP